MRFAFIAKHRSVWPVAWLCEALDVQARRRLELMTDDFKTTISSRADREQRTERSIRQTLSLGFLDPSIVEAALAGRLPRGFGLKRMMDLPATSSEQWIALGVTFPPYR